MAERRSAPHEATESLLLEVYSLIASDRSREALDKASQLVQKYPHFQLAQLVYADLLSARVRPISALGDVPPTLAPTSAATLVELREESRKRVAARRERPREGTVPSQFVQLSKATRFAMAVDTSRSRLYLFENHANGLNLVADYYASVGKAGVSKSVEGDQRTPLGVYYITSNLDPKSLKDTYGSGALTISYPNVLDARRGKTGGGIWLHGTPPNQYSRPPLSTDGCVVVSNADLDQLIKTVEIGSTPIVIAPQLNWVDPRKVKNDNKLFENTLQAWADAKATGKVDRVLAFYTQDFSAPGKTRDQWADGLRTELATLTGRALELKDRSLLRWSDSSETMIATFGEVVTGNRTGKVKRQYWTLQNGQWKIFHEGVI